MSLKNRFLLPIICTLAVGFLLPAKLQAQIYFPPTSAAQPWDTLAPSSLGWCQDSVDALYDYLELKNTKSFIVLKDGKMVLEKYFGTYTQDSLWYWASAGKSLCGFLVGCAQEDGHLNINDRTDQHLGIGWTSAPPAKEALITIRHQLSMSTGLDDGVPDPDCLDPACLQYLADAGTRWSYYNAPYRLLQDVLDSASGQSINLYTLTRLGNRIGMGGLWFDYVRYGKARDMARFGLLCLNNGVWDNDTILHDTSFFNAMMNSSQSYNQSYGYLWWLNGKGSYMLPTLQFVFNTDLIPNGPADMRCALGKNDQKIYVIPSQGLVVVRQGNAAGNSAAASSSFDNELWGRLSDLSCPVSINQSLKPDWKISPNPIATTSGIDRFRINGLSPADGQVEVRITDIRGKTLYILPSMHTAPFVEVKIEGLNPGIYVATIQQGDQVMHQKILIQ